MSLAEICDTGLRLLREHFVAVVGITAVLRILTMLGTLAESINLPGPPWVSGAWSVLVWVVHMSLIQLPSIGVTLVVADLYLGRSAAPRPTARALRAIALPALGTWLLSLIGLMLGLVLLVLPAFYLGLAWLLVPQVMVVERRFGRSALTRSRALMRDNFGRAMAVTLVGWITTTVFGDAFAWMLGPIPVVAPIAAWVAQTLGEAYMSTLEVVLYFDIRCRREGFDLEHLARLVEAPVVAATLGVAATGA